MRRQWIDEEKPALPRDEPGAVQEDQGNREPHDTTGAINGDSGLARSQEPNEDRLSDLGRSIPRQEDQGDDGHNGLFIPDDGNNAQEKVDQDAPGDVPEHDELDDLLREQEESVFNTT